MHNILLGFSCYFSATLTSNNAQIKSLLINDDFSTNNSAKTEKIEVVYKKQITPYASSTR